MSAPDALPVSELERRGALLRGHFQLSSGLHSDRYVQCALLFQDTRFAEELGRRLAALAPPRVELVVSPALGGLIIGHETARALGVPFMFTERVDGTMALRRGFTVEPGRRVLIVEDVLTTGKSTREVIDLMTAARAEPLAALSIIDRGVDPDVVGVPVASLLHLRLPAFSPEGCPLCKEGVPAVKPGSRPKP